MLRATLRPARAANAQGQASPTSTGWLSSQVVSLLQLVSRTACEHPIRTIVFVAALASTSYISLLDTNLFEPPNPVDRTSGQVNFHSLLAGSKTLHLSSETAWKWQNGRDDLHVATKPVRRVHCICHASSNTIE